MFRLLNGANAVVFALAANMALFASGMAARSAELLILSESNANLIRECNGKDVAVSGSNGRYILTGGCQSLTISGYNNQVLAEMAGGGELTVLRTGNAVIWSKLGEGPSPSVTAGRSNVALEMGADGVKAADALGAPDAARPPEPAKPARPTTLGEPGKTGESAPETSPDHKGSAKALSQTAKAAEAVRRPQPKKSQAAGSAPAKSFTKKSSAKATVRQGRGSTRRGPSLAKKIPLIGSIQFAENSAIVSATSAHVLSRVAAKVRHSGAATVRIIGHDDARRTVPDGTPLAKHRAQAVARWLVRHGRLSRRSLRIEAVATPTLHPGVGAVETAFPGRVNIIAVPRKSPNARVRRAVDQGGAEKVETGRNPRLIDLRNSPTSTWIEDAAPPNLKKPGPTNAGEASPHP
jgi:outer membrane protein OmpA-like peptidoglycan-associated protein